MGFAAEKFGNDMSAASAFNLEGRNLIVGCGVTGASVARFLYARGADMRIVDDRATPPELDSLAARIQGLDVVTGSFDLSALEDVDRLILSPGLPMTLPLVVEAKARGIRVINDIEIFANIATAPIVAVTGSNGKSTVATLVAELLQAAGLIAPAGGNLGPPALDLCAADADAYVLEISSFQMEAAESLQPVSAAVLNVTPDHLDRHNNIKNYAGLKEKLLLGADNVAINDDDPLVRQMAGKHSLRRRFSTQRTLSQGSCVVQKQNADWVSIDGESILPVAEIGMAGRHNLSNVLAALELVRPLISIDARSIEVLKVFRGLPHRCELVARKSGVTYINDSKATNVAATISAIEGLNGPIVWIAGGRGKNSEFSALRSAITGKVSHLIAMGETADELVNEFGEYCSAEVVDSIDEAVRVAQALTSDGDTVLLSPACSSLDMFVNYEARGDAFRHAVEGL